MAPQPKECAGGPAPAQRQPESVSDEDIVISGVSGLLPNCDSFMEFSERLYNKENMVKEQSGRWKLRHPDLVPYHGMIRGIHGFDAQFFTVYYTLAHSTEPTARKLFEQAYQAVFDAGICPSELSGRRIGVYMTVTLCDSEKMTTCYDVTMGIVGGSRTMFANRISYYLNLKGPSMTMDGDCCGSLLALAKAQEAIQSGVCEAAIVGSGKLVLHPQTSIMYKRTLPMNSDGKTKCYDTAADGQSLSEAITVMFLQKYKEARRAYGVLKHAMADFGASEDKVYMEQMQIPRSVEQLTSFFTEFYTKAGVSPSSVDYVDGYGQATPEMDKMELEVMDRVFCKDRKKPLLVGSVASNVGFTDASAGTCGLFKIILGYQHKLLAANLHCDNPRQDVAALRDGRMRIVTEHTPFDDGSLAAVNVFSVTGINAHALVRGYQKPKDPSKYHTDIPYLVTASGRQESAVERILNDISSRELDPEEIALIHNIFKIRITKHLSRGFGIYSSKDTKTEVHCKKVDYYDDAKKPLWFVYSGMGSQWVGMGKELMRIPVFAESITKCHKTLEPKGLDLINIITCDDKSIFDNILHSFVGISAIQVALTDLLTAIGLVPDKFIGHSLGELGCAYADGSFTAEQVMMLAYLRGIVSITIPLERGAMAAVGMGFKQLSKICPPEIDIACHNSSTSSTISGPIAAVQSFVKRLTEEGVFAKEVKTSNIAYHSRYIAKIGPDFLKMSKEIVKKPKLRSERWISSSVPKEKQTEVYAIFSSAEYHTNNLLNTVLFEEALRAVPPDAVMVEVAPRSLMAAILKRALPSCKHVAITKNSSSDNVMFLLEAIGDLYMSGYDADVSKLYPKVEFPVSMSTRPLSHLVEWAHGEKWKVCQYLNPIRTSCSVFKQIVSVHDDDYKYLRGHQIEGVNVFPFAACIVSAWDTLAMTLGKERGMMSVQFQDVKFFCQPALQSHELTYITTQIHRGSGYFEVYDGNVILMEGFIFVMSTKFSSLAHIEDDDDTHSLYQEDVYKLLYERGYEYKDKFRTIHSMNACKTQALIEWQDNWVTFIDTILQTTALSSKHFWISQPKIIKRMTIDIKIHSKEKVCGEGLIKSCYDEIQSKIRCGGVTIERFVLTHKTPTTRQIVSLQSLQFMPFDQTENYDIITALNTMMQIISENIDSNKITMGFVEAPEKQDFLTKFKKYQPPMDVEINITGLKMEDIMGTEPIANKPDAIFMHDLLADKKIFEVLYHTITSSTFIINIGTDTTNVYPSSIYRKVSSIGIGRNRVELAKFKPRPIPSHTTAITIRSTADVHQLKSTCESLPSQHKVLVLTPHPTPPGLKDQVKFWRKEQKDVSMVMFDSKNSMDKELECIPDIAFSTLSEGKWGGEYYVPTKLKAVSPKNAMSLTCLHPGDLSSLTWVEREQPSIGVEVKIHYAGLVAHDASRAQGEGSAQFGEDLFGMDFSGVTARGERVMGLMGRGSASNKVMADPNMLWPVPAHWSMEDAATVPYAYCYALYILTQKCKYSQNMRKERSILIHGGAGGLGQALISVALARGLEIFVTVSDIRKKHFLKKLFPELKDDHIGNSRDGSMSLMVQGIKKGNGTDIIVNCARGYFKNELIKTCADLGVLVDTTPLAVGDDFSLGMYSIMYGITYVISDFKSIFNEKNGGELKLLMAEGIVKGFVKPLSRVTYAPHETTRAFRLLAASRHRGRVLLSMLESQTPQVQPRMSCKPSDSYVVVYKDEDFGVQFTDLLVRRGARKLHLHAKLTAYLNQKIQNWEELGVHVEVSSVDLTKKEEASSFLERSNSSDPLEGIFVVATNSKEKPKVSAATLFNLDMASRTVCPNLRYFAIISEDDQAWRHIITERARKGMFSLSLVLPKLNQFDTRGLAYEETIPEANNLYMRAALKAVEEALFSGDHVVTGRMQPYHPGSILEEVAKIPGVNITKATVDRVCLEQVGVDHGRAQELCNVLEQQFRIILGPDLVPKMTIGQLKQLKKEPLEVTKDSLDGFETYFNFIDEDEVRATSETWLMPTLIHRTYLRADEIDLSQDTLCIIPGLEGHYNRFHSLCERLKIPTIVLQHGHNHLNESFQETAQRLANLVIKYLKPTQRFYLLGYEFGVTLSLEVAAILESYGMTGTVYMLGGTPEDFRNSFTSRWNSQEAIQDALIQHVYTTVTKTTSLELEDALRKCNNWSEKLDAMVNAVRYKTKHTGQFIRGITEGVYARIKFLQEYNNQPHKLQSKIVFIQTKPFKATVQTLKLFTKQEPVVVNLNVSLAFALKDLSLPSIVNSHLGKDILEAYKNSNQCDTILINGDNYMNLKASA